MEHDFTSFWLNEYPLLYSCTQYKKKGKNYSTHPLLTHIAHITVQPRFGPKWACTFIMWLSLYYRCISWDFFFFLANSWGLFGDWWGMCSTKSSAGRKDQTWYQVGLTYLFLAFLPNQLLTHFRKHLICTTGVWDKNLPNCVTLIVVHPNVTLLLSRFFILCLSIFVYLFFSSILGTQNHTLLTRTLTSILRTWCICICFHNYLFIDVMSVTAYYCSGKETEFHIEPELTLELMMAANYLHTWEMFLYL